MSFIITEPENLQADYYDGSRLVAQVLQPTYCPLVGEYAVFPGEPREFVVSFVKYYFSEDKTVIRIGMNVQRGIG